MEGDGDSRTSPLARSRPEHDILEDIQLLCQEIWRTTEDIFLTTKETEVAVELERVGFVTAWAVAEVQRIPTNFLPSIHDLLKEYKWILGVIRDGLPLEPLPSKLPTGFGMKHVDRFVERFQDALFRISTLSHSQFVSSAYRACDVWRPASVPTRERPDWMTSDVSSCYGRELKTSGLVQGSERTGSFQESHQDMNTDHEQARTLCTTSFFANSRSVTIYGGNFVATYGADNSESCAHAHMKVLHTQYFLIFCVLF